MVNGMNHMIKKFKTAVIVSLLLAQQVHAAPVRDKHLSLIHI